MTAVPLTSLGSPVEGDRLWVEGLAPRTGGGWNWIGQFYNAPNPNPTEWIVAHLSGANAGTYDKYEDTIASTGHQGRYADTNFTKIIHQIRASNGWIYWPAISTYGWIYKPDDEQVHEMPQLPYLPGESNHDVGYYDAVFNVDGSSMWWGTIQAAGVADHRPQLVQVNPTDGSIVQYGRVGSMSHTLAGYAYYVHADGAASDWVYVLVGQDVWDVVAIQISTKTQTILAQGLTNAPWADFTEKPEGLVVNLYTHKNQVNQTVTSYWIVDGVLYPYTAGYDPATLPFTHRTVTPYSNPLVSPPEIDDTVCPYAINWRANGSTSSTPWTRLDFTLDYLGPLNIEFLAPAPGGVLGGVVQYQGWFWTDGATTSFLGEIVGTGVAVAQSVGLTVGGLVYVTGYPNAILDVYDPTKAWDAAEAVNPSTPGAFSNGNSFSGVKTAARLAYGAQKNRLYMCGGRDRSGFGGGVGYRDLTAHTWGGTFANLALYTTHYGLVVFDGAGEANRVVLGAATSDASEAQLVLYDLDLNEIERQTPVPGMSDTGRLYRTSEPSVVVGVSRTSAVVYRWDIVSKTLVARFDLSSYGTEVVSCAGPDGTIDMVVGAHLLRIDPVTLDAQDLGTLTGTVAAIAETGGLIYLAIGTTLYTTPVPVAVSSTTATPPDPQTFALPGAQRTLAVKAGSKIVKRLSGSNVDASLDLSSYGDTSFFVQRADCSLFGVLGAKVVAIHPHTLAVTILGSIDDQIAQHGIVNAISLVEDYTRKTAPTLSITFGTTAVSWREDDSSSPVGHRAKAGAGQPDPSTLTGHRSTT